MIVLWMFSLKYFHFHSWFLLYTDNEAEKKLYKWLLRKYRQHIYLWTRSTFSEIVCMKAQSIQKKHVIYELFAYLPLLRRMLKTKKKYFFVDIFILFVELPSRLIRIYRRFSLKVKKKHQQKSRKCAMSNRWMRAHPLKHKHNDIKCPNIKMWIDINNQDGCVRLISTKSDPNVNKQVCGIIRTGKNYFFWEIIDFFVLYQIKKRNLCCLLVILPPPVSFPGKQNFLIFFVLLLMTKIILFPF